MKRRGMKTLLTGVMSAFLVIGELGSVPLTAYAGEQNAASTDKQITENNTTDKTDEYIAAGSLDEAAFSVPGEEEQIETAQQDLNESVFSDPGDPPVQIAVIPEKKEDSYFTWQRFDNGVDSSRIYESRGKDYIENSWYDYAVSTSNEITAADQLTWIGGTDLIKVGMEAKAYLTVDQIIMDMMTYNLGDKDITNLDEDDLELDDGNYYLYVGRDNKFSAASLSSFEYTKPALAGTAGPNAEWHCFDHNYVKKVVDSGTEENPTEWHYDFYEVPEGENWPRKCPKGYEDKKNYRVVIENRAEGVDNNVIGYIIEATGTGNEAGDANVLDRNGSQRAFVYRGDGEIADATSTHILIDNYKGLTVRAVRKNGEISSPMAATKMEPWKAADRHLDVPGAELTVTNGRISFDAPDFAANYYTWTDDKETPDDPSDDEYYVEGIGYRAYVNYHGPINDELRYAELQLDSVTMRATMDDAPVSYIWTNSILAEMNRLYICEGVGFKQGEYDVYIATNFGNIEYVYYHQTFSISFAPPNYVAVDHDIYYETFPTWVKDTPDGVEEYRRWGDETDDEIRAKIATEEEYKDYYEMKRAELSVDDDDDDIIGYIIKANGQDEMINMGGSTVTSLSMPVNAGKGFIDFIVSPEFKINNATITRVTNNSKKVVKAKRWHWYDELDEDLALGDTDPDDGIYECTALNGTIVADPRNPLSYEYANGNYYDLYINCLDDIDVAQDMNWYSNLLHPDAGDQITISHGELATALARDKVEAELTGGARGNDGLICGDYGLTVVTGTYVQGNPNAGGPVARSNEYVIDLENLGVVDPDNGDIPEALYSVEKKYYRAVGEGEGRHWQSIDDYYWEAFDGVQPDGDVYWDDRGNLINFWDLPDSVQAAYITEVNAELAEQPDGGRFVEKDSLYTYLSSSEGDAVGYIVRLSGNRFSYDDRDNCSYVCSRAKGEEAEIERNKETGLGGVLEKPFEEGQLMVAAVYSDGSISEWQYGRERHEWDEWPVEDMDLELDNDGVVSWDQTGNNRPDIYVERTSDGIWFRTDVGDTYNYNAGTQRGSFKLNELLMWMADAKYRGRYDHKSGTYVTENLLNGDYRIRILMHPDGDGYDKVSAPVDDVDFIFDTSGSGASIFSAYYEDHTQYVKRVLRDNGEYDYDFSADPAEGYTEVRQYEVRIKEGAPEFVAGYVIKLADCDILDAKVEGGQRYTTVPAGRMNEGLFTTKEWLLHAKGTNSAIQIAAVDYDGTLSEWVTAVPLSQADQFEDVEMGIGYDAMSGWFDANEDKLNTKKDRLAGYSFSGENPPGPDNEGYSEVADASVVFRGAEDYGIGTRLLKKDADHYRIREVNLPAIAAADELMAAEGQVDEGNGEPWRCLPGAGTYTASLVIWPQFDQQ